MPKSQSRGRILYLELKSGHGDSGPAFIGRVTASKTGRTLYYRGKTLRHIGALGVSGNYADSETGEEYWVSGPKKNGQDRHPAGSGPVSVDDDVAEEYWTQIRGRSGETMCLKS